MRRLIFIVIIFISIAILIGCGSSRKVSRTSTDTEVDLSGRWNDTDSRITAEKIIGELLNSNWLANYNNSVKNKPVVIVGNIKNQTSEHIQTSVFIKDIERELVNSGKVKFVASKTERTDVRDERLDQQSYSSLETAKRLAEETGADFMLSGILSSLTDAIEGQAVKYYQVDLELINLENNEKEWMGSKKIKKIVEQDGYKF